MRKAAITPLASRSALAYAGRHVAGVPVLTIALHTTAAGLVAIAATVAVERFGGRLGGVLGSLPTTVVPASLGIAASASGDGLADAMAMVPVGLVLNAGFLWLWRVLPRRLPTGSLAMRLSLMTMITVSAWLVAAVLCVVSTNALVDQGVPSAALGAAAAVVLLAGGLLMCRDLPPAPRGTRRVGPITLAARGLLAATAIGAALGLANVAGPVAAGVASTFPAIFLTTMVALWVSQGEAVPTGAIGPIVLGASSVSTYALVASLTIPALGLWGAVPAWIIAFGGISVPAAGLLLRLRDAPPPSAAPTPAP